MIAVVRQWISGYTEPLIHINFTTIENNLGKDENRILIISYNKWIAKDLDNTLIFSKNDYKKYKDSKKV